MSVFSQWQRAGCPVRRVTWVCGPETALAEDVAARIRSGLPSASRVTMFAGTGAERDIWAECGVIPPADQQRLVVVREAHRLRCPGELVPLVKAGREAADSFLLFVSGDADFTREGGGLAPHLAAIRDYRSGQLIRCTRPKDDDLLDWVAGQWPGLGRNAAYRLLERAGGDLAAVRAAGAKAIAAGLLEEKYVSVLCDQLPGEEFADLIISGDRKGALDAVRSVPFSPGAVTGLLASRLSWLAAIREGQQRQLEDREISARFEVPRFAVSRYRDAAQAYGPSRVRGCRVLLAEADSAWRSGASRGIAEVLAANW